MFTAVIEIAVFRKVKVTVLIVVPDLALLFLEIEVRVFQEVHVHVPFVGAHRWMSWLVPLVKAEGVPLSRLAGMVVLENFFSGIILLFKHLTVIMM